MTCKASKLAVLCAAFALVLGFVSTATAQVFTGRIDVTVEDTTGGRLPGVNVDLSGPASQSTVSDANGEAHFLNLPVGIYTVKATLSGFNPFNNANVQVATGSSTPIAIRLGVAGTAETVNVTAATPLVDVRRQTTTTNVTLDELQNIPTARDPWVVMQSVPTIYVDRVNVGGSESGQQSNYVGKGSTTTDNTWSIDGVPITDMGATGSTPTYYDFDMFQEMSITTGGADAQNPTPGVQLNLVLKKGTNTPHGNARWFYENEDLQGNNLSVDLATALNKNPGGLSPACVSSGFTEHCGNRTDKYQDYGFDLGGPILKDRLWAWGSAGKTNPRILVLNGSPDETILKNYAFKADAAASTNVRGNFTFFKGNKEKFGRGASAVRPPETTYNQTGPTKYYKGEGNFVVSQSLFAAVRYAYIDSGFSLTPQGGDKSLYVDDAGVWHNSFYPYATTRPQYYAAGDASYFKNKHEVKFGFAYRRTPVDSASSAPGNHFVTYHVGYPDLLVYAVQDYANSTTGKYQNAFVTDTISMGRMTLIAGVRWDRQTSSFNQVSVGAVTGVPFFPPVTANAVKDAYKFNVVTPRLGLTYALDESRKTVARASYAMFSSQLPANAAAFVSPIQLYTYVYYNAVDRNGNNLADLNEIDFAAGVQGSNNVDTAHPGQFLSNNKIGSDLKAPRTQELMFGVDRELMANFGVSATLTYRYMNNFIWNPRNGVTPSSFVQTGTYTGTAAERARIAANLGTVSIPYYGAPTAQLGYTAQNRPDYHQRYLGFELSATKRMANRWMARVGFGSTNWNEYFDSRAAIMDPTRTASPSAAFGVGLQSSGPLQDGGPVAVQSSGSGKSGIFLLPPKYQVSANGMYQAKYGIDIGFNYILRQGYAQPFYRSKFGTNDAVTAQKNLLLVNSIDDFRLDAVSTFDGRVEKMFKFGRTSAALDLDVFNLFNRDTVLQRQLDARVTTYNNILEVMQPRIARLGVRFSF